MLGNLTEEPYPQKVAEAVRELPNFRYGGFIPLAEINTFFRAAHLHVKTSLPMEGFPNTFVQSWMHGVPVASLEADLEAMKLLRHVVIMGGAVHGFNANSAVVGGATNATQGAPTGNYWANTGKSVYSTSPGNATMSSQAITNVGGSQAHLNMQPFLVLNFCIALQGIFPSQN
jgi:hypothetical protein